MESEPECGEHHSTKVTRSSRNGRKRTRRAISDTNRRTNVASLPENCANLIDLAKPDPDDRAAMDTALETILSPGSILTFVYALASLAVWFVVVRRLSAGEEAISFHGERLSNPNKYVAFGTMGLAFVLLGVSMSPAPDLLDELKKEAASQVESSEQTTSKTEEAARVDEEDTPRTSPSAAAADEAPSAPDNLTDTSAAETSESDTPDSEPASVDDQADATNNTVEDPFVRLERLLTLDVIGRLILFLGIGGVVAATTLTWDGWGIRLDHIPQQITIGLAAAIAAILPTVLIGLLMQGVGEEQQAIRWLRESESPRLWKIMFASAVFAAPLLEELVFRIVIQGWLTSFIRPEPAITWTAMLFAAVHGWPAMVGLMPFALIIGYVYYQTRSLLTVVVMHMTFNASMLILLAAELSS